MGRELQKKKNRSSNPKVKQKPKSKRINPLGNPIIAANWYYFPTIHFTSFLDQNIMDQHQHQKLKAEPY